MKRLIVSLLASFLLLSACAPPQKATRFDGIVVSEIEEIQFYSGKKVLIHSEVELNTELQAELIVLKQHNDVIAFGAMYIGADGTGFGTDAGLLSIEDAKAAAQVNCEEYTGQKCTLYATVVPETSPPAPSFHLDNKFLFDDAFRERRPDEYLAVAKNRLGVASISCCNKNPEEAFNNALEKCRKHARENRRGKSTRSTSAYKKAGLLDCQVVGVYR
ncbi:hypothetical protein [Roseobacter litoralis]|uniref:hypothetical protein n=1 Tax=Roseobacter litoralis TaxID=42443 RepID=UPI0024913F0D|nr:hypothetical protein [Roseobacter litoralis]